MEGIYQCENNRWFTLRHFNQGFLNLVGYTEQELTERFRNRYLELMYEPDRESMAAQVKEQLNSGRIYKGEYRLVRKDGSLIWALDHCLLAADEDGSECFYSILLDITKSKQDQEELRLSLERHEIIRNQSNDIIFEWDVETDTLMVSSNWEKRFGYQPIIRNASEKLPVVSHIHPDDAPQISNLVREVCAGQGYIQAELRFAEANGRYRWCRVRATTQLDAKHHPVKVVGVLTDIDNEKRATDLATVGRTFNISRAYIFETIGDGFHCGNTYEWCNEGIRPEQEKLRNYPYVEGDSDYRDNFTEGGVFSCPDIKKLPESQLEELERQGILSVLQCAIIENGEF